MPVMRRLAGALVAVLLFAETGVASADTCTTAYENVQLLRRRGELLDARRAALECTHSSCPAIAKKDCTTWIAELDAETPTVVVVARDEDTANEGGARVFIDGVARPDAEGGRSVAVDPGVHTFRVERAGSERIERSITIVQGEQDRVLLFALKRPPVARIERSPLPPSPSPTPSSPSYLPAIAVGSTTIVAFALSAWLGLDGRSDLSDLRASCAPACGDDRVDPVRRKLVASDVALGIGIVGVLATAYFLVSPPRTSARSARVGFGAAAF